MNDRDAMDVADILAVLPRGNALVDRVVRCEPGMMIETWKAISTAEPCYGRLSSDAPPDAYDYPEELLLESFAQSARLLWARTGGPGTPELAGTRGVAFHHPVRPGAVLRSVVKLVPGTATTMFFAGRSAELDGPLVLTVDNLVLTVRDANAVLRTAEPREAVTLGTRDCAAQMSTIERPDGMSISTPGSRPSG